MNFTDPKPRDFFLGDDSGLPHTYLPEDYRSDAHGHNVVATVHVEAECSRDLQVEETAWLTELHTTYEMPNAIVAHTWLDTDNAEAILERQAAHPLVRSIRSKPVTSSAPHLSVAGQPHTMQDPKWLQGFKLPQKYNLSWDLRVPYWHLQEAASVAHAHADTAIVLNHTGFSWDRSPEGLAHWRAGMQALAAQPNVYCKLSYLSLRDAPWTLESNRPIVRETIAMFDIDRCMFASNFGSSPSLRPAVEPHG